MRDIVETSLFEKESRLKEVVASLERDAEEVNEIRETGTDTDKIIQYEFHRETNNGETCQLQAGLYIKQDQFQARGDAEILNDYFAEVNLQELQY